MNSEGGNNAKLPPEMLMAIVCEKMGWTFDQYENQPVWFVQTLITKWVADTAYQKEQSKVE